MDHVRILGRRWWVYCTEWMWHIRKNCLLNSCTLNVPHLCCTPHYKFPPFPSRHYYQQFFLLLCTHGHYQTQCTFNKILSAQGRRPCFTYTIAGGDRALLISTEAPEDSCAEGVATLKQVLMSSIVSCLRTLYYSALHSSSSSSSLQSIAGKNKVLYVGISCGLSVCLQMYILNLRFNCYWYYNIYSFYWCKGAC